MLQVTDMIQSYKLNFHPVPCSLTVSFERYTLEFQVCYRSLSESLHLAAALYIYIHYALKKKRKERTVVMCHVARPDLFRL